jgi:hypothetical protein
LNPDHRIDRRCTSGVTDHSKWKEQMLSNRTRDKANSCLRQAIVSARESRGLNVAEAAAFTGLTESEFLAVETHPILVSCSTLYQVMKTFEKTMELSMANNKITALLLRDNQLDVPGYKFPVPKFSPKMEELPSPEH